MMSFHFSFAIGLTASLNLQACIILYQAIAGPTVRLEPCQGFTQWRQVHIGVGGVDAGAEARQQLHLQAKRVFAANNIMIE